jgi:serine/threonine protein kinase
MSVEPGDSLDRYEVLSVLGRGGMATVYSVRHRDLGTHHALKVLHVDAPGLSERLLFEGRVQASLRHPNVCRVSDVVRIGKQVGLVMDLVRGPSLEQLLDALTPNLLQIDLLADGMFRGLHAAHLAGLVHRDVKAANVLVDLAEGRLVPKVSDFGLARALDTPARAKETRAGTQMGTPGYMAPEQYRDAKSVDARADVFSLACVLYELVSGAPAFPGDHSFELYEAAAAGRFRPLEELAPHLPARVSATIARALSPHAAHRFQTVDEMREAWFAGGTVPGDDVFEPAHLALLAGCVARLPSDAPPTSAPPSGTIVPQTTSVKPPEVVLAARPSPAIGRRTSAPSAPALVGAGAMLLGGLSLAAVAGAILVGSGLWWLAGVPGAAPPPQQAPAARPAIASSPPPTTPTPPPAVPSEPAPSPAPAPSPVPAPSPAPAPRPRPTPPPAPPPEPVVVPASAPVPAPVPAPPAPPRTAHVEVVGLDRVFLVSPDGVRVRPGDVAPGRWSVVAFFEDGKATTVLHDLLVDAGDRRTVRCDARLKVCR